MQTLQEGQAICRPEQTCQVFLQQEIQGVAPQCHMGGIGHCFQVQVPFLLDMGGFAKKVEESSESES